MPQEEIYFIHYLRILIKHKWVVIAVPIISVLTTSAILFLTQKPKQEKEYIASVKIRNGCTEKLLIEKQEGFELIKIYAGDQEEKIKYEDIPGTSFFNISYQGKYPDVVKKIAESYVAYGNNIYNDKINVFKNRNKYLTQQKAYYEESLRLIQDTIKKMPQKEGHSIKMMDTLLSYQLKINDIKDNIKRLENDIAKPDSIPVEYRQFEIISPVKIAELKKDDKKVKKILVSAMMGIIGGIILAVLVENWIQAPKMLVKHE